jgi:microcompartment protein CcmK/EutM
MNIGRIVGTVVATRKDENLVGSKLMVTQPLDLTLKPKGEAIISVDTVGAGVGELVIYIRGSVGRFATGKTNAPIDSAIVGIIDELDVDTTLLD